MNGTRRWTLEHEDIEIVDDKVQELKDCEKAIGDQVIAGMTTIVQILEDKEEGYSPISEGWQEKLKDLQFEHVEKGERLCHVNWIGMKETVADIFPMVIVEPMKAMVHSLKKAKGFENSWEVVSEEPFQLKAKTLLSMEVIKQRVNEPDTELQYRHSGMEFEIGMMASIERPYSEYFDEYFPNPVPYNEREHTYSVSLHRAIAIPETTKIFKRFMKKQFDKDEKSQDFSSFLCNSPLVDEEKENLREIRTSKKWKNIDSRRIFKDEGPYPECLGSYHLYHWIDGEIAAVSVLDITKTQMVAVFLMYDPDYSFLSLGHVTAIREIEFMKMIREKYNPQLRYYMMGHYNPKLSKVAYKANIRPQMVLCPLTMTYVYLTDSVMERMIADRKGEPLNFEFPIKDLRMSKYMSLMFWTGLKLYFDGSWLYSSFINKQMQDKIRSRHLEIREQLGAQVFARFRLEYNPQ